MEKIIYEGTKNLNYQKITIEQHPILEENNGVFTAITDRLNKEIKYSNPSKDVTIEDYAGLTYTYKNLGARKGGGVFFVEIADKDNTIFSCVMKGPISEIRDTEAQLFNHVSTKEKRLLLERHLPKLYGVVNNWEVIEEITGFEPLDPAFDDRLANDQAFRDLYAKEIFNFIYDISCSDLKIQDTGCFTNPMLGNNYFIDPETGKITLTEIGHLKLDEKTSPTEKIIERLIREAYDASLSFFGESEYEKDLLFQVFKHMLNKIGELELLQHKYRRSFNKEFIQSIKDNNLDKFEEMIKDHSFLL